MKKKVDTLGRIGIPKPIREAMAIKKGSFVSISYNPHVNEITLRKEEDFCAACGNTEHLQKMGQFFLCQNCINQLKG